MGKKILIANRASTIIFNFLASLQLPKSKYLVIPSNICHALLFTVIKTKIPFKYIDLNENLTDYNWEYLINDSKNISGIIYTHLYGNEYTPWKHFKRIKQKNPKIIIIDDRCLCLPKTNDVGNEIVDLVIYSTGPKKQVNLGSGGFGYTTNLNFKLNFGNSDFDSSYVDKALYILQNDIEWKTNTLFYNYIDGNWLNQNNSIMKFSELKEKIKLYQEKFKSHKDSIKSIYKAEIPIELQYRNHYQNWRFNIKCSNSEFILKKIFEAQLFASKHYFPMSKYFRLTLPNSELLYSITLNLFIDNYIQENAAMKVASLIKKYGIPIKNITKYKI